MKLPGSPVYREHLAEGPCIRNSRGYEKQRRDGPRDPRAMEKSPLPSGSLLTARLQSSAGVLIPRAARLSALGPSPKPSELERTKDQEGESRTTPFHIVRLCMTSLGRPRHVATVALAWPGPFGSEGAAVTGCRNCGGCGRPAGDVRAGSRCCDVGLGGPLPGGEKERGTD